MRKLFLLLSLLWATTASAQYATTAPTRPTGDNSNAIATTAFVSNHSAVELPAATTLQLYAGSGVAGVASVFTPGTNVMAALQASINASGGLSNVSGAITAGNCLRWGPGIQDAGAACGAGGGSGTVASGTKGQFSYYAANGTMVSGIFGCLPIEAYGGSTANSDNTTALAAAFAALPTNGGCILFGPGKYTFTSNNTLTLPAGTLNFNLTLSGTGKEVTTLYWASAISNALTIALNASAHTATVRDMTFATGAVGGGTALNITQSVYETFAPTTIENVVFRGVDGISVADYWNIGVNILGLSNTRFNNDDFYGTGTTGVGAWIAGVNAGGYSFSAIFTNCGWWAQNVGVLYGSYVQDIQISNSTFGGNTFVSTNAGELGSLLALEISNNQISANVYGLSLATGVEQIQVSNNLFYIQPNYVGVYCLACQGGTITGNVFYSAPGTPSSNVGVYVGTSAGSMPMMIAGNTFYQLANGINLAAGSSQVTVTGNGYYGNTNAYLNSGTGNVVGASCSGTPSTNFFVLNGMVTHC